MDWGLIKEATKKSDQRTQLRVKRQRMREDTNICL